MSALLMPNNTTTMMVVVWLLLAATSIASTPWPENPSGHISFTPGLQGRHITHAHESRKSDDAVDIIYGQLARRQGVKKVTDVRNNKRSNASSAVQMTELLSRAPPGEPGVDLYGKLVQVPGCFFCPPKTLAAKTGRDLLGSLDTMTMQSYMRISSKDDLENKCVFYTAAVRQPPRYLSEEASIWACQHSKYSIWHLWPNKVMADNSPQFKDFYGIENPNNWLHSILNMPEIPADRGVPTHIQYFEYMSEAMAMSCSGEVVIMSQTTNDMARYLNTENIWKNKERPALQALNRAGKISRFLVVDYDFPRNIYEFDIDSNTRGNQVPESDLQSRDLLPKRAVDCSNDGLGQILSQGDPFSDDYSNFR